MYLSSISLNKDSKKNALECCYLYEKFRLLEPEEYLKHSFCRNRLQTLKLLDLSICMYFRSLRALCVLLDLSPEKVTIDGILRPSTVLMLLFSHAGPELASPHVSLNWNIEKLSLWWESHTSEEDR